ncbi:MAG: hypothetical protein BWY66_02866 [bacterium ADurb.Bin374]|nr:MAG: hypothetical protein BWY66_02866 [bacterium ADurb.Bin374]
MGLVDDDRVPLGAAEFFLDLVVSGKLVEAGDEEFAVVERVARAALILHFAAEQIEAQAELLLHFVLPLLDQAAGGDDEHATGIGAQDELADIQAGHDRFSGAGVVGEDEPERLPGKQGFVDRRDLVRERLDVRGVDRHHGVEEIRGIDAPGLGRELEVGAGRVERPGAPLAGQFEAGFIGAE